MNREEAKIKWNRLYEGGFMSIDVENLIIDKIYDALEGRTCETCAYNITFDCEILQALPFGHDEFGCIKWEDR